MAFRVHRKILAELPEDQRDKATLEKALWDKTGGKCFLCEDLIQPASDDYEADHDDPSADGGTTDIANLNLAHASCNRMKRAAGSRHIRPYIKFSRYLSKVGSRIKYDGALPFFGITPAATNVEITDGTGEQLPTIRFDFSDGSSREVPLLEEKNEAGTFHYAYLDVPRDALFNDEECQPRVIKREQVGAIYSDIRRNPLHEPPSARLESDGSLRRLLMFDGQHKTIANWLMGRQRVVVKVYTDLSTEAAVELVNSIQAKIKKLPLSPFELASKLSEEWEDKLAVYEAAIGESEASEAGFIAWLPADDRQRAKQAFRAALIQRLLSDSDLRLSQYAASATTTTKSSVALTETIIRSKVLERLLFTEPMDVKGEALTQTRDSEASNIIRLLNSFTDLAFEPQGEGQMSEVENERARRMAYQSSLAYCASLLRDLWANVAMKGSTSKFALSDSLSDEQWLRITEGIDRLVAHPVWTADFSGDAMAAVKVSLEKNQNAQNAFEGVGMDLPYLLIGTNAPSYKAKWGSGTK